MSVSNEELPLPCWVDDRVLPRHEALSRVDDSAALEGRAHYTTARVSAGGVLWLDRHIARLRADALRLQLPAIDERDIRAAFRHLAPAAFGLGDGAIRLQHSVDSTGRAHLIGIPRSLGDEPDTWSAIRAPLVHEGPQPWSGAKISSQLLYTIARDATKRAGVREALFADAEGRLIEGAGSNVFVARASGEWATPDLVRGGVAGLARAVVLDACVAAGGPHPISVCDIGYHELANASEVVAMNALRGARSVVALDGRPVGSADGPLRKQLSAWIGID
ncbi:MAG: aminotransferase class IV [Myxococcota bacterium]|nr:aminotransferase class IV [Myxococcota bacterium]